MTAEHDHIKNPKETQLLKDVDRKCPECDADISLKTGTLDCEIYTCPDCGYELETAFFDPNNPIEVQKILSRATEQGSKKEERYDGQKLDFTQSPALIPAPQEEEDFGQ